MGNSAFSFRLLKRAKTLRTPDYLDFHAPKGEISAMKLVLALQ